MDLRALGSLLPAAALGLCLTPAGAQAGSLGTAAVLTTPTFTSPVSAVGGTIAWAGRSGHGHRFEIVVRRHNRTRALRATSAVGWIDGVKLGTDARGRTIVVYSRCPHSPFATASVGSAGTDGCRLWWFRLGGQRAHRVKAAPRNTSVGVANHGSLVFAVQPSTAHRSQPARLERGTLTGSSASALTVPSPAGATIADISAVGSQVAFIEAPIAADPRMGDSDIWLDTGSASPQLLAKVTSDTVAIDNSAQFFDGLTLSGGFVYAFLFADSGIVPPVSSQLDRIALDGSGLASAPWTAPGSLGAEGVNAAAFDGGDNELVLDLFSPQVDFSTARATCSPHRGNAKACPIVTTGPVSFP